MSGPLRKTLFPLLAALAAAQALWAGPGWKEADGFIRIEKKKRFPMDQKITKADKEWKKELTPDQYHILREKGTERPFTGELLKNKEQGQYLCAACGLELFGSDAKFDSGTGWPSFYKPAESQNVEEKDDRTWGMRRTEVMCARCGGHLGHVFPDGPNPTGLRYCINSGALAFKKNENKNPK
jgi:peptide-methionine (R)-S-oxide reductase